MKNEVVYKALNVLKENTGVEAVTEFTDGNVKKTEGELILSYNDKNDKFLIYCKKELNPLNINEILNGQNDDVNTIVIAYKIRKDLRKVLRKNNLAYCDVAGNAFIRTRALFILIEGLPDENLRIIDKNRAFTKAGLKVVYFLLNNPDQVNATYRQIAEQTGVALDTINKTLLALKTLKYIIAIDQNTKKLWDIKKLAERWINTYDTTLKPALFIGNYKFLNNAARAKWKETELHGQPTWWGGEPAADILTNYLNPEIFTVYTEEPESDLIKKYRMLPDKDGEIKVYRTFWKNQNPNDLTVDPFLVYTDLINTSENRNIETANLIYDKFLNNKF